MENRIHGRLAALGAILAFAQLCRGSQSAVQKSLLNVTGLNCWLTSFTTK